MRIHTAKKRLLSICICVFLAAAFIACGKGQDESKENETVNNNERTVNSENKNEAAQITEAGKENTDEESAAAEKTGSEAYLQTYQETGELPSLKEIYKDKFYVGVALPSNYLSAPDIANLVVSQFSSMTCENEMKPDYILDRTQSQANGDEECPAINMKNAEPALKFAEENGLKMRFHVLVWHSQTPRWFFTEGYSTDENARYVTREVMLARMENYIKQVMEYVNTNYPGVVYAWDVVNEAISGNDRADGIRVSDNIWYDVVGPDYVEMAFKFAGNYVADGQKLFYNDYGTYDKTKIMHVRDLVQRMRDQNIRIDGIGMQDHVSLTEPTILDYQYAINKYADMGLEVQVTELDINNTDNSEEAQKKLAARYKALFTIINNVKDKSTADITSVTFWGLTDSQSWLNKPNQPNYPLLFDKDLKPKLAFFAAAMDDSISMISK